MLTTSYLQAVVLGLIVVQIVTIVCIALEGRDLTKDVRFPFAILALAVLVSLHLLFCGQSDR